MAKVYSLKIDVPVFRPGYGPDDASEADKSVVTVTYSPLREAFVGNLINNQREKLIEYFGGGNNAISNFIGNKDLSMTSAREQPKPSVTVIEEERTEFNLNV